MICVDSNGQAIEISVADQMWLDDAYFKGKQMHLEADAPRVALAYRVSTKGQVDHDDIPMQKIDCRKFAQKQGWRVVKEVAEKGVSGSKVSASKRDAIQQLKEEAANGEFDILLVYMFDRLGRIESETPFVLEWFVQHGIQMWSTHEGQQKIETHGDKLMNDIFENTETMKENEHPRFYTAESVMRGHPDKLCDLIADSVLDACLQHDPASRVACEVMATHGHIIVAGEITTSAKPDVFNIVRDTLRDVGYDPKAYQIDCYIHDQSPDIAGAVEPELAEGEDEDTLGAGDQGVMVGYACNETPEYLPMPVVAAQRLVTLLEISRMTGVIPDIGPDGKVQVTMEYNGDTPVRITTVVVSVQHKEDTDINKLADLLDEYVFPLAFDGMPADDAEIILNPSGKFVQGGPDADTGLTGRKLMVDSYGTFAPHGGGAFSGKDATKVDRSGAYMARYIAKNMVAAHLADRCQVTLAYAIGGKDPVMVDVNTFGTGICEDDCLAAAVRKVYDLTPAGIIKQLNLLNPIYSRTAAGGHFGREDFPWENVEHMSDLAAYIV